nr:MAG TPA: hypothetical protein [Caudoviricetes sp.]
MTINFILYSHIFKNIQQLFPYFTVTTVILLYYIIYILFLINIYIYK